jgi:methyl-accepting chemotaxis protein
MLLVRLGGDGIEYTGDVYVTNIKLDSTALALADIDLEVLASSYGDGLAGVEVSNFDGMDALHIQTKFANVNGNWQEVTSRIDVKGINIADTLTSNFAAKLSAVEHIVEYDKDILALKAENNTLNTALTNETSEVRSKIEELTNTQKLTMSTLIYVVFIVGAVLVVLLTIFVITSVQKSIKKFKGTLTHISEGEITVKAETGSGDEFDTFGRSLNRMTDKLSDVITNVKQYGIELKNSGAELETMSRGSEQTSEHIDAAISEIALGATNQARDVENSTNEIVNLGQLMDTMDADISELDETSINMKQASDEAVTILSALSRSNGNMTEGIHRIAQHFWHYHKSDQRVQRDTGHNVGG